MERVLRIGTRDSQLAVWQANLVKDLLSEHGYTAELVFIKSEGDTDLQTPLYEIGVQGIFTRSLDIALLNDQIDLAVHSMKDVPTQLAKGIVQSAVLKRASYKDLLVFKGDADEIKEALGYANGKWAMGNEQRAMVNGQSSIGNNTSSPLTIHHSSSTIHHSPLTISHSPLTT